MLLGCFLVKLIASFHVQALHWLTRRSWPALSVSVIITAPGSRTEEADVTIWGLRHIPGSDQNLQQSQMTYDCSLNARKCDWLHLHTQHKPDVLPIGLGLYWHGYTHLFLSILWHKCGLLITSYILMRFPIYFLSDEKLIHATFCVK